MAVSNKTPAQPAWLMAGPVASTELLGVAGAHGRYTSLLPVMLNVCYPTAGIAVPAHFGSGPGWLVTAE